MLNRKLLALVLPAVAVSALVGSGFSAWYFNEENIEGVYKDVNVSITNKVDKTVGTLTLNETQATTLTLDQGGYANATALDKGISFDKESVGAKFTFSDGSYDNLKSAGMKVQITTTVTFSANLLNYVEVIGYTLTSNVYTVTEDASNTGWEKTISLMSGEQCTFLKYKKDKKPQNSDDYDTMVDNLNGATITFNWTAAVVTNS